jgi:hypothetical protein
LLDKRLPTNLNVENHACGHQYGWVLSGATFYFYDLDSKERIENCPACGMSLEGSHGRFEKSKQHAI